MRSSLFWNFTKRWLVVKLPTSRGNLLVPYWRSSSPRTAWFLKMGSIGCPETSVNNYQSMVRKIPEELSSQEYSRTPIQSHCLFTATCGVISRVAVNINTVQMGISVPRLSWVLIDGDVTSGCGCIFTMNFLPSWNTFRNAYNRTFL
jgi:hypothetical protein